jgi:hypothetical protein
LEKGRREFFKDFFREIAQQAVQGAEAVAESLREEKDLEQFFDSYESSYALTLNYPDDIFLETARMEGIEVEGRDKIDIAKEMFAREGGGRNRS